MEEHSAQEDVNVFQAEKDSKAFKKIMNINKAENASSSNDAMISEKIDEEIANIQAEAVMAAAKSLENVPVNPQDVKLSNLDVEAALSNADTIREEATSSKISDRRECQITAEYSKKMSEECRAVAAKGQDLMETMLSTIQVLQSHVSAFATKAFEATERQTRHGYNLADFYRTMTSKYKTAIETLENRSKNVEIALNRVEECGREGLKFATIAEKVTDETLDVCRQAKFSACWWTNKGRAAIIVALQKEREALLHMKNTWISVRDDMLHEEGENRASEEDSDGNTPQCENRDRSTKIAHIVSTFLGIGLLFVTSLFKSGSDSFNAILALGILTTVWCAIYWSYTLYKYCKSRNNAVGTVVEPLQERDGFLENCDRHLNFVEDNLRKHNVILDEDAGSSETVRVDDVQQ